MYPTAEYTASAYEPTLVRCVISNVEPNATSKFGKKYINNIVATNPIKNRFLKILNCVELKRKEKVKNIIMMKAIFSATPANLCTSDADIRVHLSI